MNTPAQAILWEIWRHHQFRWVIMLGLIPAGWFMAGLAPLGSKEWIGLMGFFAFLFSMACVFWIFSYAEPDARGRHGGFPARMFRLPMPTWKLVLGPVLAGLAVLALFFGAWMASLSALFHWSWGGKLFAQLASHYLTLAAMLVSLQAIVWSLHRHPWIRMISLMAILVGLAVVSLTAAENQYYGFSMGGYWAALAVLTLGAYGAAVWGVERERRGDATAWADRVRAVMSSIGTRRTPRLASIQSAQFWCEWRRTGWFIGSLLGAIAASAVMVVPVPSILDMGPMAMWVMCSMVPVIGWCAAFSVGFGMAKSDFWSRETALAAWIGTRPVRSAELVWVKWKCAAAVTLVGALVFVPCAIPAFHLFPWLLSEVAEMPAWSWIPLDHSALVGWATDPLMVAAALAMAWLSMVQSLSWGLTGRPGLMGWRTAGLAACYVGLMIGVPGLADGRWGMRMGSEGWLAIAVLVVLVKECLMARCMMRVLRARLVTRREAWAVGVVWLGLCLLIFTAAVRLQQAMESSLGLALFIAAVLMPAAQLGHCLLNLERNRHR